MTVDERVAELTDRISKLEAERPSRSWFLLQYVFIPLLVAICGVGGGVWVASISGSATVDTLNLGRKLDGVGEYAKASTLLLNHLNDLVDARTAKSAQRRQKLEDLVSEDLARVAGAIAALKPQFSPTVSAECDALAQFLETMHTDKINAIDGNSEIVKRLRALKSSIDKEIAKKGA